MCKKKPPYLQRSAKWKLWFLRLEVINQLFKLFSYILFFRVLLYIWGHTYVQIVEKKLCYTDDYTLLLKFGVVCILKLLSCKILSIWCRMFSICSFSPHVFRFSQIAMLFFYPKNLRCFGVKKSHLKFAQKHPFLGKNPPLLISNLILYCKF